MIIQLTPFPFLSAYNMKWSAQLLILLFLGALAETGRALPLVSQHYCPVNRQHLNTVNNCGSCGNKCPTSFKCSNSDGKCFDPLFDGETIKTVALDSTITTVDYGFNLPADCHDFETTLNATATYQCTSTPSIILSQDPTRCLAFSDGTNSQGLFDCVSCPFAAITFIKSGGDQPFQVVTLAKNISEFENMVTRNSFVKGLLHASSINTAYFTNHKTVSADGKIISQSCQAWPDVTVPSTCASTTFSQGTGKFKCLDGYNREVVQFSTSSACSAWSTSSSKKSAKLLSCAY